MNKTIWKWMSIILLFGLAACQPKPAGPPARISGVIHFESASGVKFPLAELRLMDTAKDQKAPEAVVGTIQTDETGSYEFTNLKPGTYSLGLTASMPGEAECSPPSLLRLDQWLIGASYVKDEQGKLIPTLLAVWDARIEAKAGDDLHYDLELAIECKP